MSTSIPQSVRRLYDCHLLLHPETAPKRPLTDDERREVVAAQEAARESLRTAGK